MNPTIIIFKGKEYPTRFGFGAVGKWEDDAGMVISELETLFTADKVSVKNMSIILKLAYYGIESGLKREGEKIDFTYEDFVEETEFCDFQDIVNVVTYGIQKHKKEESENKRQPTKKPK